MKKKYSLKQLLNEEMEQLQIPFEEEFSDQGEQLALPFEEFEEDDIAFEDEGDGFGADIQDDVYLSDEIPDEMVEYEFGDDGVPFDDGETEYAFEDLVEGNTRGKKRLNESRLLTEAIKAQNLGGIKGMVMTLDFLVNGSSNGWTAGPVASNFKKSFAKAGSISGKDVTMAPSSAIGAQAFMDVKYAGQSTNSAWSQKAKNGIQWGPKQTSTDLRVLIDTEAFEMKGAGNFKVGNSYPFKKEVAKAATNAFRKMCVNNIWTSDVKEAFTVSWVLPNDQGDTLYEYKKKKLNKKKSLKLTELAKRIKKGQKQIADYCKKNAATVYQNWLLVADADEHLIVVGHGTGKLGMVSTQTVTAAKMPTGAKLKLGQYSSKGSVSKATGHRKYGYRPMIGITYKPQLLASCPMSNLTPIFNSITGWANMYTKAKDTANGTEPKLNASEMKKAARAFPVGGTTNNPSSGGSGGGTGGGNSTSSKPAASTPSDGYKRRKYKGKRYIVGSQLDDPATLKKIVADVQAGNLDVSTDFFKKDQDTIKDALKEATKTSPKVKKAAKKALAKAQKKTGKKVKKKGESSSKTRDTWTYKKGKDNVGDLNDKHTRLLNQWKKKRKAQDKSARWADFKGLASNKSIADKKDWAEALKDYPSLGEGKYSLSYRLFEDIDMEPMDMVTDTELDEFLYDPSAEMDPDLFDAFLEELQIELETMSMEDTRPSPFDAM